MRYITPDLLVRFGSPDDKVASRASQEWEKAHAAYVAHLAAIGPQLPKPLRRLLKRFYLHDAKVLAMTLDEASSFSIYLELEKPSRPEDKFLDLKYRLVSPRGMHLISHPELAGDGKALGWWQYDEGRHAAGARRRPALHPLHPVHRRLRATADVFQLRLPAAPLRAFGGPRGRRRQGAPTAGGLILS
jgi:hypothetical protein